MERCSAARCASACTFGFVSRLGLVELGDDKGERADVVVADLLDRGAAEDDAVAADAGNARPVHSRELGQPVSGFWEMSWRSFAIATGDLRFPRTSPGAAGNRPGRDVSHGPPFSLLATVPSNRQAHC